MVAFAVTNFGGMIPRQDPRLLPEQMAEIAVNCDLASGPLDGLPQPEFIIDLSIKAPWPVRKAYRVPGPKPTDPDVWMPLPSEFSSVCRSPLANDTLHAVYWTNPQGQSAPGPWWNTYERIRARAPDYNMGFVAPNPDTKPTVTASGGTGPPPPLIVRSYVYTYVDQYGFESSPTQPSDPVAGPPDATWTVTGLVGPVTPGGKNYPAVVSMRLYRTITSDVGQADFYFVADIPLGTTSYADATLDTVVVNNNLLESTSWLSPVNDLDGLISMPGGMLVGFTGNTVHFCEPDRPHAWPAGYDQSLVYPIMALAVWQQSLVVLTQGFPSTGTGTSPSQFVFAQVQAPEPCIARGSVVTDLAGVYYASQNGLIMLNYFGMQNQTLSNMTRELWLGPFKASNIIACRHRAQYLAINGTGMGFVIDYTEQRMGIAGLSPLVNVVSVWNDAFTGDTYMCADGVVYRWDSITTPKLIYQWRSKQFYLPAPTSLGACQISLDSTVASTLPPPVSPPPGHGGPSLTLPPGVNAVFRLFAGPEGKNMTVQKNLAQPREIFRLPSGRKAFCWQFEIVSNVPVHSVELASTMRELKGV